MSEANSSMPSADFRTGSIFGPPPGLTNEEIDSGEAFRGNADHSNESRGKLQMLLNYLLMFEENQITDLNGYKHILLSRRNGGIDPGALRGCLRPRFLITDTNGIKAYWGLAYLLMPGGDGRSLIPLPPIFQGAYLDDQGDDPAEDNSMLLSDGDWAAYLKIEGYEATLLIQAESDPAPASSGNINDGSVWRLATWSVEGFGTDDVKTTDEEFYSCPFLPTLEETAHPFFPFLYQKKGTLKIGAPPGPEDQWYMKVWYGAVHDILTGHVTRVTNADGNTELAAKDGETWWVSMATNDEGYPVTAALVNTEPSANPFQQPEDPTVTSGHGGSYKWKAFELTLIGDRLVPRIFLGSDISWHRTLFKNVGGGEGRVYYQFNTETFQNELRTISGEGTIFVTTMGQEIIIDSCAAYP